MNKERILEILESAKDKNDDVPMNLVRKAFDHLPTAEPDLQPTCNNLATDTISRQAAIDAIMSEPPTAHYPSWYADILKGLPSAQPEIIRCKECRKHNQGVPEAPYIKDRCPMVLHRGYAKGHEFDYQYCVCAERREE